VSEPSDAAAPSYGRIRDLIRKDILDGKLTSGARLKVSELAQRYSTSTIPVREALQQLQGEGLVTFAPNRGASVRPIDEHYIRNIHEVRELAEPFLARWFARHHTDEQLAELEKIQQDYDAAADRLDLAGIRDSNARFHDIIYEGHYNDEVRAVARRHSDFIAALARRYPMSRARMQAVSREHRAILAAIRAGNEDETARLVAAHVHNAGLYLIELLRHAPGRAAE
jgi:DNA-binding GntR family transcriptional regulator